MALAQSLTAVIIFWAIIGGIGASLLLPAMQSLIHGNFEGAAQRKVVRARRRRRGDRGRRRAASRRLHHDVLVVARRVPARGRRHRDRAVGHQARARRALHGDRGVDLVGAVLSDRRHGRRRARHPRLAGRRRGRRRADRRSARAALAGAGVLARRGASAGQVRCCSIPDLFTSTLFRFGVTGQMLQQIALGGTMIALPIFLQMVLEYNAMESRPLDRAALAQHVRVALLAGSGPATAGRPRSSGPVRARARRAWSCSIPIVPRRRLGLVPRASRC